MKAAKTFNGDPCFQPETPCKKHPLPPSSSSSSVSGICPFCLRDRLLDLICHECGEQRLSSCSCSENSSDRSLNPEIGRISFLLENENPDLKRSNSSFAADVTSRRGFWRIGRFFRKKAHRNRTDRNDDLKSEMCVSDLVGVPRSRSLCSFRGRVNGGADTEESSNARVSSVSGGFAMDSAKRSCFSESEARMSNFEYEKDLIGKGGFIDLKVDLLSSSVEGRNEKSGWRRSLLMGDREFGFGGVRDDDCDRDMKKWRSRKVWRWFLRAGAKLG